MNRLGQVTTAAQVASGLANILSYMSQLPAAAATLQVAATPVSPGPNNPSGFTTPAILQPTTPGYDPTNDIAVVAAAGAQGFALRTVLGNIAPNTVALLTAASVSLLNIDKVTSQLPAAVASIKANTNYNSVAWPNGLPLGAADVFNALVYAPSQPSLFLTYANALLADTAFANDATRPTGIPTSVTKPLSYGLPVKSLIPTTVTVSSGSPPITVASGSSPTATPIAIAVAPASKTPYVLAGVGLAAAAAAYYYMRSKTVSSVATRRGR